MAKLYASVWLNTDPELMQQSVMELQQLYAQGGFAMDADFRDLLDHVAVQAVEPLRTAFLVGHLGRWLGVFILAVHNHAQSDFYRELAEFTERFVRLEGRQQNSVTRH